MQVYNCIDLDMKRDMDLARDFLLFIESQPPAPRRAIIPGMTIAGRQPLTGKLPGRPKAMNVYAGRRRSRNGSMTTRLLASPRLPDRPRGGLQ